MSVKQQNEIGKAINSSTLVKIWLGSIVTVVGIVLAVVFWIQQSITDYGDKMFYPKISGTNTEQVISEIKSDLKGIYTQNKEIIEQLGELKGSLQKNK